MADLGMDAYRFSISWSRILPSKNLISKSLFDSKNIIFSPNNKSADGTGEPNPQGIAYYNNLINSLIKKGSNKI